MIAAAVERFRAEAEPLDGHAAAVLDRLAAEDWRHCVRPAFDLVPAEDWPLLLSTCIEAERVARTYASVVDRLKRRAKAAEKATEARLTIKKFLSPKSDSAAAGLLELLRNEIKYERRFAQRGLLERRKNIPEAARSAGIGVLAEAIRVATGQTHRAEVADLANAIFNTDKVTEDMVRHALTPTERRSRWLWTARSAPKKVPERAG